MWMTGTYDPELNLLYVGTGNPTPVLNGQARPGDNKWTGSIVALNPDTGHAGVGIPGVAARHARLGRGRSAGARGRRLRRRAAQAAAAGVAQRLLLRARSRHRQEPADDAVCGRQLGEGHRRRRAGRFPNPDKEPARDGRLVAPDEAGGTNYRSPSFDPATGLLIVSAHDAYGIYFFKPEHGAVGWAGADYTVLRPRRAAGDRLPDRQDPLEPRPARRRRRGRRADDGHRA